MADVSPKKIRAKQVPAFGSILNQPGRILPPKLVKRLRGKVYARTQKTAWWQ